MANPNIMPRIAESIHTVRSASVLNVLKSASESSSPKEYVRNFRAIAQQGSQQSSKKALQKKRLSKVDEWSNGLRESLMSNLFPRSKYSTTIGGFHHSSGGQSSVNEDSSNTCSKAPYRSPYSMMSLTPAQNTLESNINELVDSESQETTLQSQQKEVEHQKVRSFEENNWATMLQKTVDLNVSDISGIKTSGERKKLTMDINVIVNIKPCESSNKIGFQEIAEKKKMEQIIEKEKSTSEAIRLCNNEHTTDNKEPIEEKMCGSITNEVEKLKDCDAEVLELKCNEEVTKSLTSKDILVEELGMVYSFHQRQGGSKNVPASEVDDKMPDDVTRNVSKLKDLYKQSLTSADESREIRNEQDDFESVQEEVHAPSSRTTQNISGTTTAYNAETQSPLEISNVLGACSSRTLASKLTQEFMNNTSRRAFSTTSLVFKDKKSKKDDCDKAKKLPCLQASKLSKVKANAGGAHKGVCEKFCMPCCKPARDPPECFYPYHKPPCTKHKPPRPSFSECKQIFPMKQIKPCECVRPRPTTCKASKESAKCSK